MKRPIRVGATGTLLAYGLSMAVWVVGCSDGGPRVDEKGGRGDQALAHFSERIFAPSVINTGMNERDATMTPDGDEFYFTVWSGSFGTIMVSHRSAEGWGSPQVVSFSGVHNDLEPFVSPDGSQLFFASTRPVGADSSGSDYNIWVVDRTGSSWDEPQPVEELLALGSNEYYPSVTAGGDLYFTSKRDGGVGGEDIWHMFPEGEGYGGPQLVPGGVNTERDEFNAYVAPDGSYLIFSSWGRDDGHGGGDLYISFLEDSGEFGGALNMGPAVNSSGLDYSPYVSPDASTLYYSSRRSLVEAPSQAWTYESLQRALTAPGNGLGDILRVEAAVVDSLRAVTAR